MAAMLSLPPLELELVPDWRSDNFTTIIDYQLASRPNNAHVVHAASTVILNLIAMILSRNGTLLSEPFVPYFQDMVRACVIKMRYAYLKEAHELSRYSLWDHIQVDRTANDMWWSGFSELHEAFGGLLRAERAQQATLPTGAAYFRHSSAGDSRFALLILNTEMQSVDQYPDKLPTFRVTERLAKADAEEKDVLQHLMQWVNLEDQVHSAAAIVEHSRKFLNYETNVLEVKEDASKLAGHTEY